MSSRWTFEEELMIKNGLTNSEVSKLTGRTEKAVQMKRYKMTGRCEALPREGDSREETRAKEFRILKIKNLAHKLGVKLFGKDE